MKVQGFIGVLKVIYTFVTAGFLLLVLVGIWSTPTDNREPNIGLYLLMSALTFPSGQLLISALVEHVRFLLPSFENRTIEATSAWVVMFAAGYVQWFLALPWLVTRYQHWYRERRAGA